MLGRAEFAYYGSRMRKARVFALMSAFSSLVALLCIPAALITLFIDWRVAVGLVPVYVVASLLAYKFNGLKLRAIHGDEIGGVLEYYDWATGRELPFDESPPRSANQGRFSKG